MSRSRPLKNTTDFHDMIYDHFRLAGAHDAALDISNLIYFLKRDDIQDFGTRWDKVLLSASGIPQEEYLGEFVQVEDTRLCSASDSMKYLQTMSKKFIEIEQCQAFKD